MTTGVDGGECQLCGADSAVRDSRPSPTGIRRRRQCLNAACGHRWFTYELAIADIENLRAMRVEVDNAIRTLQRLVNRLPVVPELTGRAAADAAQLEE